eukprot:gb/GECG01007015.1/.p1 GENE.gb/GECG01007015.1/~~gb/GECG01007015.1/.p1  ORF type:complete len:1495 (+),score=211.06 gb/GECG01007015.1/:1-4485(+)
MECSACLKSDCPGFSPQFYHRHQCAHCGVSILYHRAQPSGVVSKGKHTLGRSSAVFSSHTDSEEQNGGGKGILNGRKATINEPGGISEDPFVWPRTSDHSLSHTFEALVTVSNLNLLWIKRSRFKDGSKIKRAARKLFDLGLTAPPAVADLQGKWMISVSVTGNEDNYVDTDTLRCNTTRSSMSNNMHSATCSELFRKTFARNATDFLDNSDRTHSRRGSMSMSNYSGTHRSISSADVYVMQDEDLGRGDDGAERKEFAPPNMLRRASASLLNVLSRKKQGNTESSSSETDADQLAALHAAEGYESPVRSTIIGNVMEAEHDFPRPKLHRALASLPYHEKVKFTNITNVLQENKGHDFDHSQLNRIDSTERVKATTDTFRFRKAIKLRLPKKRSLFEKTKIQIELFFIADSGNNKFCAAKTTFDVNEYAGYFMDNEAVYRHSLSIEKPLYGDNGVVATGTLALRHMAPPRKHIVCPVTRGTLIQNTLALTSDDEQIIATEEAMETSLSVLVPVQFLVCRVVHLIEQEHLIELKLGSCLSDSNGGTQNSDAISEGKGPPCWNEERLLELLRQEFSSDSSYEEWEVASTVGPKTDARNSMTVTCGNLVRVWWSVHQHRLHLQQHIDFLTGLYLSARRHHSRFRRRGRHFGYGLDETFINKSDKGVRREAPFYKSSAQKANAAMSAMPTNLHIQLLCASQKRLIPKPTKQKPKGKTTVSRRPPGDGDTSGSSPALSMKHSWGQEIARKMTMQSGIFGLNSTQANGGGGEKNDRTLESSDSEDEEQESAYVVGDADADLLDGSVDCDTGALDIKDLKEDEQKESHSGETSSPNSQSNAAILDRAEHLGKRLATVRNRLHERLRKSGDAAAVYDSITLGAPAYHAGHFRDGGLFRLRARIPGLPFGCPASSALSYVIQHSQLEERGESALDKNGGPGRRVRSRTRNDPEPKLRSASSLKRSSFSRNGDSLDGMKQGQSTGDGQQNEGARAKRKSFQNFVENEKTSFDVSEAIYRLTEVQTREDFVMSQMLAAVFSSLLFKLDTAVAARRYRYLDLLGRYGFLVQIESLLSTVSKEVSMLQDMYGVFLLLDTVSVKLCRSTTSKKGPAHKGSVIDSYTSSPRTDPHATRDSFYKSSPIKAQVQGILERTGGATHHFFGTGADSTGEAESAQQLLKAIERNISGTQLFAESSDEENFEFDDDAEIASFPSRHKRRILRVLRTVSNEMFCLRFVSQERTEKHNSVASTNGTASNRARSSSFGKGRDSPSDSMDDSQKSDSFVDRVSMSSGGWVVELDLSPALYDMLPESLQAQQIQLVPLLFTQGINEQQSFANAVSRGGLELQRKINWDSFYTLAEFAMEAGPKLVGNHMKKLDRDLRALKVQIDEEQRVAGKHPRVLSLAADIVRMLHGGRITCCKSGKDRTAMSVTYEQARILEHRHGLGQHRVQEVANLMRSEGPRKFICAKNVGEPLYAFNAFQSALLPAHYRPPPETLSGTTDVAS